jgi:hypothetical protein
LRNLKSVRRTPLARSPRFALAALLSLCAIFHASGLYALHEVDHRFTVKGRICGDDGEGIGAVVVSVKNTRADISGKGKTDNDGFYEVVLHLHNENQGDPLVVQSGEFNATGRVELDPSDSKTERIITINLGQACRVLPFWRQTWVLVGFVALLGIIMIWAIRQVGEKNGKGQIGHKIEKAGKDRSTKVPWSKGQKKP